MSRYNTTIPASNNSQPIQQISTFTSSPYANGGQQNQLSQEQAAQMQAMQQAQASWPKVFPKGIIGIERDGVIVKSNNSSPYITNTDQIEILPGALEGIRLLRLKGYKLLIITDQPGIFKGLQTTEQVDAVHAHMMQLFGNAGIFSIDGIYYSTSDLKNDIYAKPNTGMFERASNENRGVDWKKGWFVGNTISDLKAAEKIGSKPVLIQSGKWEETLSKLDTFANRDLKSKTNVYSTLLQFAESLP